MRQWGPTWLDGLTPNAAADAASAAPEPTEGWTDRPRLTQELRAAWDCYAAVSKRRDWIMGGEKAHPQPFSISELNAYCDLHGLHGPARLYLWQVCEAVDDAMRADLNDTPSQSGGAHLQYGKEQGLDGDHLWAPQEDEA